MELNSPSTNTLNLNTVGGDLLALLYSQYNILTVLTPSPTVLFILRSLRHILHKTDYIAAAAAAAATAQAAVAMLHCAALFLHRRDGMDG